MATRSDLAAELDELKNPTDRPPATTPREGLQVIDRERLFAAWESNVKTMRAIIGQLQRNEKSEQITRFVMLCSVIMNLLILGFVVYQIEQLTEGHRVVSEPLTSQ
jgi:hypothetical protein